VAALAAAPAGTVILIMLTAAGQNALARRRAAWVPGPDEGG
jgi:hypothetical protein